MSATSGWGPRATSPSSTSRVRQPTLGGSCAMPESFEIIEGETRGRAAVARVRGRLDAGGVQLLLAHTSKVLATDRNLVLNLSEVSFIGSSGIGALLVTVELYRQQHHDVRIVAVSQAVALVIQVLNLVRFLPLEDSEEDGLSALAA